MLELIYFLMNFLFDDAEATVIYRLFIVVSVRCV